jgi:hypothetical protein
MLWKLLSLLLDKFLDYIRWLVPGCAYLTVIDSIHLIHSLYSSLLLYSYFQLTTYSETYIYTTLSHYRHT